MTLNNHSVSQDLSRLSLPWLGHDEALSLAINGASIQLSYSMRKRAKKYWRNISSQHWSRQQFIAPIYHKLFSGYVLCGPV